MPDISKQPKTKELRYAVTDLINLATQLFIRAGLSVDRAQTVARILVEADLMGHYTHGLQLVSPYLKQLAGGTMTKTGEPTVIADHGSAITWDGLYLPGPWLTRQAMDLAFKRIANHPVVTIVIRRSHHIACLAAYPKQATDRGLMMLLTCSDPSARLVAPYGGIEPVYTPNPLAAGIPTRTDPIILDISMSTTAMGRVLRARKQGMRLPNPWLLDHQGNPTDDPEALFTEPGGSILPLGGIDLGYKGFALGILVEALTAGLGGYGRADAPTNWGGTVFLQIIDPDAFGGKEAFLNETQWFVSTCQSNPVKENADPVRLPGERALKLRKQQLELGIILYPTILPGLQRWAEKYGLSFPKPILIMD